MGQTRPHSYCQARRTPRRWAAPSWPCLPPHHLLLPVGSSCSVPKCLPSAACACPTFPDAQASYPTPPPLAPVNTPEVLSAPEARRLGPSAPAPQRQAHVPAALALSPPPHTHPATSRSKP
eukprot:scaffold10062_cov99-Isochrysis_galbana.AAC.2